MSVMLTGRPRTELLTCRDVVEAGRTHTQSPRRTGGRDDAVVASLHEDRPRAEGSRPRVICIKDGRVAFQGVAGEVARQSASPSSTACPGTYDPAFGGVELVAEARSGLRHRRRRHEARRASARSRATARRSRQACSTRHDADGLSRAALPRAGGLRAGLRGVTSEQRARPVSPSRLPRGHLLRWRAGSGNARNAELLDAARAAGIPRPHGASRQSAGGVISGACRRDCIQAAGAARVVAVEDLHGVHVGDGSSRRWHRRQASQSRRRWGPRARVGHEPVHALTSPRGRRGSPHPC